jgi:hypothetical protein
MFFVPGVPKGEAELVYARLAVNCGCQVPSPVERIREVRWTHDGDEWVATVGENSTVKEYGCGGEEGPLSRSSLRCTTQRRCAPSFPEPHIWWSRIRARWARSCLTGTIRLLQASRLSL